MGAVLVIVVSSVPLMTLSIHQTSASFNSDYSLLTPQANLG